MNGLKCAFVRRVRIPEFQWNLTAIIRAITVTKIQAAAQIAAWMKLTLKHTLYGHLGVMQVNKFVFSVQIGVGYFSSFFNTDCTKIVCSR